MGKTKYIVGIIGFQSSLIISTLYAVNEHPLFALAWIGVASVWLLLMWFTKDN